MIEKINPAGIFKRFRRSCNSLHSLPTAIATFCCVPLASCNMGTGNQDDGQADILYDKSVRLITAYTDSMSRAADTLTIQQLSERFELQLDRINSSVPAETDLRMSEGQNDTLAYLVEKWVQTRDKSLKKALGVLPSDSIATPADSIHNADSIRAAATTRTAPTSRTATTTRTAGTVATTAKTQ